MQAMVLPGQAPVESSPLRRTDVDDPVPGLGVHYNFCRVHQTIRVTPAMEAGLTDHGCELEEIVALLG
jgi:hypothetical protein